jgi:hypothetical protein
MTRGAIFSTDMAENSLFAFPNPVNELAARTVAGGVALLSIATIVLGTAVGSGWLWLSALLCAGFLARTATGPTLSPLGQLATRVIAPRLGPARPVPGPPKRFAQAMGLTMSGAAVVLLAAGLSLGTVVLLALITAAATLESVFAFCVGCRIFGALMRIGVIPPETCAACADVRLRQPTAV